MYLQRAEHAQVCLPYIASQIFVREPTPSVRKICRVEGKCLSKLRCACQRHRLEHGTCLKGLLRVRGEGEER